MFKDYYGQSHLVSENKPIYNMLHKKNMQSLVLHGPPGVGKTKLANIIVKNLDYNFINLNAASSSLAEFKEAVKESSIHHSIVIIIDEIHRLDKGKQNFLLQHLEYETIYVIGTTTENPYISLNNAMRSRLLIFELYKIDESQLIEGLKSYNENELSSESYKQIYRVSNGDVRMSQNIVDFLTNNYELSEINPKLISDTFKNTLSYNYKEDEYYDLLSALQKSIRASDLDGAIHYLARLIKVGDFTSLLRRLRVICYEDIGLAAPQISMRSMIALDQFEKIGMPEGRIILATTVCEMSLAPKSPSAYQALDGALADLELDNIDDIPPFIRFNQPEGYEYDRDKVDLMDTLPKNLKSKMYLSNYHASKNEEAYNEIYLKRNETKKKKRRYNE